MEKILIGLALLIGLGIVGFSLYGPMGHAGPVFTVFSIVIPPLSIVLIVNGLADKKVK